MKKFALVVALVFAPSLALADAPDHVINGAQESPTVDCGEGGKVSVNGSQNTVTITGACAKVAVMGSMNTVTVEAADKIAITGSGNTVTWTKGWKKKTPKISRTGVGNKVARRK